MPQPIVQVDAFADRPFAGNPAAVCILPAPADEGWMQRVAAEMNLSETAFLVPAADGWGLRWLTPAVEVALCGHATLASAHVLWEDGHLPEEAEARFHTRSGVLACRREGDWIWMDFPAKPAEPAAAPADLARALGVEPRWVGRSEYDVLVEVASEAEVRAASPDFRLLRAVPARGVIVTAPADDPGRCDFVSRFFAPAAGVDEDPVTGSAHCALAPHWAARLGRAELTGYQASTRGGIVRTRLAGDRVHLGGQAVTVLRGELVGRRPAEAWPTDTPARPHDTTRGARRRMRRERRSVGREKASAFAATGSDARSTGRATFSRLAPFLHGQRPARRWLMRVRRPSPRSSRSICEGLPICCSP